MKHPNIQLFENGKDLGIFPIISLHWIGGGIYFVGLNLNYKGHLLHLYDEFGENIFIDEFKIITGKLTNDNNHW